MTDWLILINYFTLIVSVLVKAESGYFFEERREKTLGTRLDVRVLANG